MGVATLLDVTESSFADDVFDLRGMLRRGSEKTEKIHDGGPFIGGCDVAMGRSCARPGRLCAVDTRSVRAQSSKGDTVRGPSWKDEKGGRQRALSIHSGMIDRVLGLNLHGWKLKRSLMRRTRECNAASFAREMGARK